MAVPDSASTAEDAAVTVNVAANDTDPDGNLVPGSVTVTVPPANGTASPNGNGTVTYTPVANFNGTNTFTYRICDATSLCATATVTVTVTPVADAPVAVADTVTTEEATAVTIDVAANDTDPDGDLVPGSVTVTVPPANGTASPNGNGTVTYTPVASFNGTNTFTYRICDATSLCATATVTVTVGRVNRYYVSLDSNGTVAGAGSVRDEDIIVYDPATSSWAMYFDASDVGISTSDLEDFHVRADGSILMSFSSALNVPGLTGGPDGTLVDDSDIVLFTPTSTGATTSGTFSFYFDGSDVGLAANSERLDGIHELSDGTLLVSTTGSVSVPGLSGADEDILWFSPSSTGAITTGTWIGLYFDGSDVGLTSSNDDLDAIVVDANGDLLYSTVGDNTVPGTLDEDINRFTGTYGANTSGTATLELALASLGIATSNDVDGLAVGR